MSVATYTKTGGKSTTPVKLDKNVFGVEVDNHQLLKSAYLAHLANGRDNLARTKRRGEVQGGGSKPWRQKGTGRARVGSSRNPVWRGGGVAFGPSGQENYSQKINQKAKHAALRQALTFATNENRIKIVETFDCPEGKIKPTVNLLNKIEAKGNILIIVLAKDKLVERSTRNLPYVKAIQANYLTVFDILNADTIVISKKALAAITAWLLGKPIQENVS